VIKQEATAVLGQLEQRPFAYVLHYDTADHWFELEASVLASEDLLTLLTLIQAHGLTTTIEAGKLVIR